MIPYSLTHPTDDITDYNTSLTNRPTNWLTFIIIIIIIIIRLYSSKVEGL